MAVFTVSMSFDVESKLLWQYMPFDFFRDTYAAYSLDLILKKLLINAFNYVEILYSLSQCLKKKNTIWAGDYFFFISSEAFQRNTKQYHHHNYDHIKISPES